MKKLSQTLWYIDAHHDKFRDRSIPLPARFASFRGYNDYKKKREKEPQLSAESLQFHVDQLSAGLMQPWIAVKRYDTLRGDVEKLVDALHRYKQYLTSKCEQMKLSQQVQEKPSPEGVATLTTVQPMTNGPTSSQYSEIEQRLLNLPVYKPICVSELAPTDRYVRRKWISSLSLSIPIMLYRYPYGNNLGTLIYAWRIPVDSPVDDTAVSRVLLI